MRKMTVNLNEQYRQVPVLLEPFYDRVFDIGTTFEMHGVMITNIS